VICDFLESIQETRDEKINLTGIFFDLSKAYHDTHVIQACPILTKIMIHEQT
jgi:hypothetical protein